MFSIHYKNYRGTISTQGFYNNENLYLSNFCEVMVLIIIEVDQQIRLQCQYLFPSETLHVVIMTSFSILGEDRKRARQKEIECDSGSSKALSRLQVGRDYFQIALFRTSN